MSSVLLQRKMSSESATMQEDMAAEEDTAFMGTASMKRASELVMSLAQKVSGHNYTMSDTEQLAVETIGDMVDSMLNNSRTQHNEDQTEVDKARERIQNVTDDLNTDLSAVGNKKNTANTSRR